MEDRSILRPAVGVLLALILAIPTAATAQGIAPTGVGPITRGMGGAATACPLDAAGAIHWNPATMSGLPSSEASIDLELVLPTTEVSSRYAAGSFGPGTPPVAVSGVSDDEPGVGIIPNMAFVHKPDDSRWTWGIGVFGIGGGHTNLPASVTNPIFTPQAPRGLGFGRLRCEVGVLQLVPTVSYVLTDRLSVGFAPTVTMARFTATRLCFAAPDDENLDGFPSYPSGTGSRWAWGGGFQAGLYYTTDVGWHFGASVKSPQWIEPLRYRTEDELGRPRHVEFHADYPLIVSLGTAYSGFEDYVIACDVRYFDYTGTSGFGDAGFAPTGAALGLGWESVWAVSLGVQRRLTDRLFARIGYSLNENPIPDAMTMINAGTPLIAQHRLYLGTSFKMTENWMFSLTYVHWFENSITGPVLTPAGPVPGTAITSKVSADALNAGITVRF